MLAIASIPTRRTHKSVAWRELLIYDVVRLIIDCDSNTGVVGLEMSELRWHNVLWHRPWHAVARVSVVPYWRKP